MCFTEILITFKQDTFLRFYLHEFVEKIGRLHPRY